MAHPYDINLIADYTILSLTADEQPADLINLKLQKLMYYIQGWHLGYKKERIIDTAFEAWVHGPVSRKLYNRFKDTKTLYSYIDKSDVIVQDAYNKIQEDDQKFIDYILCNYAGFSGVELEQKTHEEYPWQKTREGIQPLAACNREIDDKLLIDYFGAKWDNLYGNN